VARGKLLKTGGQHNVGTYFAVDGYQGHGLKAHLQLSSEAKNTPNGQKLIDLFQSGVID
jgi:hypothetical protein